jgi:hypothetical protein
MSDDFYLHEDEWGMIELLPRENYAERQNVVDQAAAFSEAHRAPAGIGWTDVFVAPAAKLGIASRGITLAALTDTVGPDWRRCRRVTTGYSSHVEECPTAFAFLPPQRDANWNIVYGTHRDELVTSLCITHCELPIMPVLHRLGTTFQLMLCDLRQDAVVDLADVVALARYMPIDD